MAHCMPKTDLVDHVGAASVCVCLGVAQVQQLKNDGEVSESRKADIHEGGENRKLLDTELATTTKLPI